VKAPAIHTHEASMTESKQDVKRHRTKRLGKWIAIQWLEPDGKTPSKTIVLPISDAVKMAEEVMRRAG